MSTRVTRFVVQALIATGAALLAIAPAQATVWVGKWDPQYGSPFTTGNGFPYNLGWAGEVKVDDSACVGPFIGDLSNDDDCNSGVSILSLQVSLYNVVDPATILTTLTFDPLSLTIDTLRYSALGKLIGISTLDESDFVLDTSDSFPDGAGTGASFAVQFVLGGDPCIAGSCTSFDPLPNDYDGPVLYSLSCGSGDDEDPPPCALGRNSTEFRPVINFTPEPGSLALLALGLLAVGAVSRGRAARG